MITSFRGNYRFLSNFWFAPVMYEGIEYPTSEHAFQAAKSLNPRERTAICRLSEPKNAKHIGRTVQLRPDWEAIKIRVMEDIVRAKFTQNEDLKAMLLNTGEEGLIEGNWWGDTFWGECKGVGENHLGRILMKIRRELGDLQC